MKTIETYVNNWQVLTKKWSNGLIGTVATRGESNGNIFIMNYDAQRIRSVQIKGRATEKNLQKLHDEFLGKNMHLLK